MKYGKVYLVGAGPGDSRLITLRAVELIKTADCVIYDGLVNPALLRYAPPTAELISVRKRTGSKPCDQETINKLIVEKAQQGKRVVRLKGGDPGMFGRAAEEVKLRRRRSRIRNRPRHNSRIGCRPVLRDIPVRPSSQFAGAVRYRP